MKKLFKNNLFFFYVMTCIIFVVLFLITGVVTTFITKSKVGLIILKTLCAWSSFYVLMIFFKRFYPNKTRGEFFKGLFKKPLSVKVLIIVLISQMIIFIGSMLILSLVNNIKMSTMLETSCVTLITSFFINLISGPIGEEAGYRGYFLTELTKKKGFIKASLLSGFLWGMQHLPLWFTMGYSALKLLVYAIAFVVSITSATLLMGYFYLKKGNIIYAILIHQLVNYLVGAVYILDRCEIFIPFAVLEALSAIIVIFIYKRDEKNGQNEVWQLY